MSIIVPRTCTEILPENPDPRREPVYGPLDVFRSAPAYVLLGDPGSGKSTAFSVEAEALGEDTVLISARDFLTFGVDNHPEWQEKTLFIDGLDEIRVGSDDRRKALDDIRHHLDALGRPRFRISCREADWLGNNDRTALTSVSTDQKVKTLRLNPLTDDDVAQILDVHHTARGLTVDGDARGFMAVARERGVDGLLSNPLTLDMLARAVGVDGAWTSEQRGLETHSSCCVPARHRRGVCWSQLATLPHGQPAHPASNCLPPRSPRTTREAFPQVAELLADAAPDILAFTAFPVAHWQKLWSNNDRQSARRLVGAVLAEQHDEWAEATSPSPMPPATRHWKQRPDQHQKGLTGHYRASQRRGRPRVHGRSARTWC